MTDQVPASTRRSSYSASASQTVFTIGFPVAAADPGDPLNLRVYHNDVETEDFTLNLAAGTIELDTPCTLNDSVVIEGKRTVKRKTGYALGGRLKSALLNNDANAVIEILQEISRDTSRAMLLAKSEGPNVSAVMPLKEQGKLIIWGANGLENGPTAENIAGAQGYAAAAEQSRDDAADILESVEEIAALLPLAVYNKTAAPTINDDSADGFSIGSRWYDITHDEAYTCLDATPGAAVWLNSTLTEAEVALLLQSQNEMMTFIIAQPQDGDYRLVVNAPYSGRITQSTTRSASGTCQATIKVNSTAIGGSANSVSTSEDAQNHTTSNTFDAGDDIVLTIASNSSCNRMTLTIKYNRT